MVASSTSHHRGFASLAMPWQLHGDGSHIRGQLSIGLIQFTLQYGRRNHEKLNNAKPLLRAIYIRLLSVVFVKGGINYSKAMHVAHDMKQSCLCK